MTMRDEEEEARRPAVVIREYNPKTDRDGTDAVDRECEVGPAGGMSLHADLLGDPVARIRHSPHYLMLVSTCVCVYTCTSTLTPSIHTRIRIRTHQCVWRIYIRRIYVYIRMVAQCSYLFSAYNCAYG